MLKLLFSLLITSSLSLADTPPPGTVKSKTQDGIGTPITSTTSGGKTGLDVNVINSGGASTVNQGSPNSGGVDAWWVQGSLGRTWSLGFAGDSVTSYQGGAWTVGATISNFPSSFGATQVGPWTVTANQGTSPWTISGSVNASQSGSWTVTANAGTNLNTSALALDTSVNSLQVGQGSSTSGQKGPLAQGAVTSSSPSYTTATTSPLSLTTSGALRTDSSATTQPISGSVTATQSSGANLHVDVDNTIPVSISTPLPVSFSTPVPITGTVTSNQGTSPWVTTASQSGSWTVTANAGTNLNTSALALDTSVNGLQVSQGSTTSGQKGGLTLGAVTSAAPSYTNAQTSSISLTTAGALRTDSSAITQPVSGTVTANAGTGNFTVVQTTGTNLHVNVDNTIPVTISTPLPVTIPTPVPVSQSGTWSNGRTWNLSSGSDSVSAVITSPTPLPVTVPTPLPVSQSGTWNINNISGTVSLPTGTTVSLVRNDYSSVNVTTSAYTQLIASTSDTINYLYIFDSSGQTLFLAVGGAGSEVNKAYIVPGGNGILNLTIPSGSRVSVKAVSANATAGELNITFLK